MNSNVKLSWAIAGILGGSSVELSHAATAVDASDSEGIQEITVTAQRRDESIQNVPITIQAITGTQLKDLSLSTFDDVVKYLPNVTFPTNGPRPGQYLHARAEHGVRRQSVERHHSAVPERSGLSR